MEEKNFREDDGKESTARVDSNGIVLDDGESKVVIGRNFRVQTEYTGENEKEPKRVKYKFWSDVIGFGWSLGLILTYIIVAIILPKGASRYWFLFILIPVAPSLFTAIVDKKPASFAYPCLVAGVYCACGIFTALWHPLWVLFLTIPVYYTLAGIIKSKGKEK